MAASALGLVFGPSVIFMLSFGVLVPALHVEFGWSVARISIGASIASVMIMMVSPAQGWLVDRFGARRIILCSLPSWAAGLIALHFLPARIEIFYLACFLLPVAALGLWPLSFLKMPTTWFDRHLGIALGLTNLGIGVGATLMPALLAYGFAHFGWRWSYPLLGLIVLTLVFPVCFVWLKLGMRASVASPTGASEGELGLSLAASVRTPHFWTMASAFFILGTTSTGLLVHQVAILLNAGVLPATANYLQSLVGVGATIGRVGGGWLLDRVDVRAVSGGVFGFAALGCLTLAGPVNVGLAAPAAVLIGLVIGAEFDVLVMLIRRYFGLVAFGRIYGAVFALFQLGGALGSAGLGLCRARYGSYVPGLLALSVLLAIGAVVILTIGRAPFGVTPGRSSTDSHQGVPKSDPSDDR